MLWLFVFVYVARSLHCRCSCLGLLAARSYWMRPTPSPQSRHWTVLMATGSLYGRREHQTPSAGGPRAKFVQCNARQEVKPGGGTGDAREGCLLCHACRSPNVVISRVLRTRYETSTPSPRLKRSWQSFACVCWKRSIRYSR